MRGLLCRFRRLQLLEPYGLLIYLEHCLVELENGNIVAQVTSIYEDCAARHERAELSSFV
jgi:hypothetical protein